MKCFKPLYVADPRYPSEGVFISVPCRKCAACVQNRKNDWARRLIIESQAVGMHYFITLTYENEPITYQKNDIKQFIKNLRAYEKDIRYFIVGERGDKNNRVHYHALIFSRSLTDQHILCSWCHGFGMVQSINEARCYYAAKYCVPESRQSEHFMYVSRKPALGFALTDKLSSYVERTGNAYFHVKGHITPIPRYNRRKLKERDIFTIPKFDLGKEIRCTQEYFKNHPDPFGSKPYFIQQQENFVDSIQRKKERKP